MSWTGVELGVTAVHLISTLFMAGLIWFVQIVHYPLFADVAPESFRDYHARHTARTGRVVALPMIAEAASALALPFVVHDEAARAASVVALALLAIVWLSTGLVQAPAHHRLARGFDAGLIRRLTVGNWIRTLAWSLRVPLAVQIALRDGLT
ncbi:MAG: hypothetical protein OEQ13_13505 [Acidobacteriota bacterium]|nr:hypothetical protein [Acidobacteriota bacterium]